jgi:RNA polymerase sigma factor (sigma-70 family)
MASTELAALADDALLLRAADGDRDAFAALVQRTNPKLWRAARYFNLDERQAEDVIQTAWMRLVERRFQLAVPSLVAAWLATIVRNEAKRLLTRGARLVNMGHDLAAYDLDTGEEPDAWVQLRRTEDSSEVRRAIATLDKPCLDLVLLWATDPRPSYAEIAATLDKPIGSLGPTLRRCLDKLRSTLGGDS